MQMTHAFRAIFAAVVLTVNGPAVAEPFEDAEAAYARDDYATALRLFRSLADEGDATAQHLLAIMYERGLSVPQDYAQAAEWYRRAADQGHKIAQFDLAAMYETGYDVQQDYVQAYMWYNLSATQGWGAASIGRTQLERAMTPTQIAKAQKLARDWKSR
jgi:TPR repeat protein